MRETFSGRIERGNGFNEVAEEPFLAIRFPRYRHLGYSFRNLDAIIFDLGW